MTEASRIALATHPDVHLRVRLKPVDFEVAFQGDVSVATSDVQVNLSEIPVTVAVPFLRRRVVAGSVGPFGLHIKPFEAQFKTSGIRTQGVIGKKETEFDLHATGHCRAEAEIVGGLAERIVSATIETIVEE